MKRLVVELLCANCGVALFGVGPVPALLLCGYCEAMQ